MFEGIFGFIGLACGIYCLYGFFMLKYKKIINRTILLPKGVDAGKCKDLEGYSREASLPLLLLGIIVTVYGAVDLYNIYVERIPKVFIVMITVVILALFGFAAAIRKCNKQYFGS